MFFSRGKCRLRNSRVKSISSLERHWRKELLVQDERMSIFILSQFDFLKLPPPPWDLPSLKKNRHSDPPQTYLSDSATLHILPFLFCLFFAYILANTMPFHFWILPDASRNKEDIFLDNHNTIVTPHKANNFCHYHTEFSLIIWKNNFNS